MKFPGPPVKYVSHPIKCTPRTTRRMSHAASCFLQILKKKRPFVCIRTMIYSPYHLLFLSGERSRYFYHPAVISSRANFPVSFHAARPKTKPVTVHRFLEISDKDPSSFPLILICHVQESFMLSYVPDLRIDPREGEKSAIKNFNLVAKTSCHRSPDPLREILYNFS